MSKKPLVCITDDSNEERLLLKLLLNDYYQIIEASSGEEAIQIIEKQIPDLLLLDVNMPGINGYEVCEKLRKKSATVDLPIIFVSGMDSTEERLAGFEAGGDEYIIKPVDPEDLLQKAKDYINSAADKKRVHTQATEAMQVAMEAMTVSSELGQIVEFIKQGQQLTSAENIGGAVLDISKQFQLDVAIMLNIDEKPLYFGCSDNSLEAKLLQKAKHSKERILDVGVRTLICDPYLILLIRDMPIDDEKRTGRLKDHLAALMDIANGFAASIKAKMQIAEVRKEFLHEIIAIAEEQIKLTSEKITQHGKNSTKIMQDMLNKLENMLFGLGLDDDQEKKLMKLANNTSEQLVEITEATHALDCELGVILESLYQFLASEEKA